VLSRFKLKHVALLTVFGLLFTFQNCSQSLNNNIDEVLQQAYQDMPFAYVATADTISYMSCTRMPTAVDTAAYYTFRVGAYNAGAGLSLTSSFLQATSGYNAVARAEVLSQSTQNSGATLQLAVRQLGAYQNVLSGAGSAIAPGLDTGAYLMELDSNPIASQLGALTLGQWQNHFAGNSLSYHGGTGLMESSLLFMESETASLSVRTNLQNRQALLALTFTETAGAGDTSARSPSSATSASVYGTGYLVTFSNPSGWANSDQRVLSSVAEIDMGGNTLTQMHGWSCPAALQYKIVQPSDLYLANSTGSQYNCVQGPDPDTSSMDATTLQYYNALRNVLPVGDWYIDMAHHCLVPKTQAALTSCYGDRTGLANVDYTSGSCTAFNQSTGAIGTCAHWVSVCLRQ
jgi:hypothetical protein